MESVMILMALATALNPYSAFHAYPIFPKSGMELRYQIIVLVIVLRKKKFAKFMIQIALLNFFPV